MKLTQLATLWVASLLALLSGAAIAQPFVISADGQEVTDQKTGLIWRRCAEGMEYVGDTCTGTASTFTHEAALRRAVEVSTSVKTWRLPNVKELSSIADKSRSNPAIDVTAFPAATATHFWSSSPYVNSPNFAWFVKFDKGRIDCTLLTNSNNVRLVRTGK